MIIKRHPSIVASIIITISIIGTFWYQNRLSNFKVLSDTFFLFGLLFVILGLMNIVFKSNMFQNYYKAGIESRDTINHHLRNQYRKIIMKINPISRFFLESGVVFIIFSLGFGYLN